MKWSGTVAQDVRAYATVIVEADTQEEARETLLGMTQDQLYGALRDGVGTRPDWETAGDLEVINDAEDLHAEPER